MVKIDNTQIIEYLRNAYCTTQKADIFILGFNIDNKVFAAEIPLNIVLSDFSGISMTSDETPVKKLRIKPLTKKTALLFQSFNPFFVCDFDELQTIAKQEYSGNCGTAFENVITTYYKGESAPQNSEFWKSGDFSKNGLEYQVKFQNATIIHENSAKQALIECDITV